MKDKKIKIAGAGLAGLTAAINLAKAGFSVEVYEKCYKIGEQYKENPQMLPNWFSDEDVILELEKCNIKINWLNEIKEVEVSLMNQKVVFYGGEGPVGYTVLRGGENSLEKDLEKQAREVGVRITTGSSIDTNGKNDFDIIATGLGKPLTVGYGRVYSGDFDPEKARVFFDPTLSPTLGYCYLFPHSKNVVTVKISRLFSEKNVDLKENFKKFEDRYLAKEIKKENFLYEFGSLRSFEIPDSAARSGSLFVGEAAGFQDELFRFGMRYAVLSGYFAAKSIIEGQSYDALWKARFMKEFNRTAATRNVFKDLKESGFAGFSTGKEIRINVDKFKKLWLSDSALFFLKAYPYYRKLILKKGSVSFLLNTFLKLGIMK